MQLLLKFNLAVLVFLATSSGITKIALMSQDVDFFGQYGFTNPILMTYGIIQLIGGALLVLARTRIMAAVVVLITFLISALVLIVAGNIPMTLFTFIAMLMLAVVIRQGLKNRSSISA